MLHLASWLQKWHPAYPDTHKRLYVINSRGYYRDRLYVWLEKSRGAESLVERRREMHHSASASCVSTPLPSRGLLRWDISRPVHSPQNLPNHKRLFEDTKGRGGKKVESRSERMCRLKSRRRTGHSSSLATIHPILNHIPVHLNWLTKLLPASKSRPFSCPQPVQAETQMTSKPQRMCC